MSVSIRSLVSAFLVFFLMVCVQHARAEDRVLWVSIGDSPQSQTNMQAAIDFAVAQKFNAICILARYRADALYQPNRDFSTYANPEPRRYSSFDTVQYIIDHGHEAGLRIYASFGCFMVSDGSPTYPSWLPAGSQMYVYVSSGSSDTTYAPDAGYPRAMTTTDDSSGLWCDPGRNDIQVYTRNVLKDFVQNYDVDGIILDRIRYRGDASPHRNAAYGYNPQALTDLVGKGYIPNTSPGPGSTQFIDARRYAIRDFIRDARADVHSIKPWIIFGATPVVYSTTLTSTYYFVFQYFPYWNSGANPNHTNGLGLLDLITPQYYRTTADVNTSLIDLARPDVSNMFHEASYDTSLEGADEMAQSICDTRSAAHGTKGWQMFSFLHANDPGYMDTLNATATTCGTNVLGATSPKTEFTLKVGWDSTPPNNITNLSASTAQAGKTVLSWTIPAAASDGDSPSRYLVYRSTSNPCKPYYANLINKNSTVTGNTFTDTPATGLGNGTWYYLVVPVDDYNNKSTSNQATAVVSLPEVIVDDAAATLGGSWTNGTSAADKYLTSYKYVSSGTGARTATFTANIPVAGQYKVYEWHPAGSNRTSAAPIKINYSGGQQSLTVNQQVSGGQWNLMGTFPMQTGNNSVVVSDNFSSSTGTNVMADAFRWEFVEPLASSVSHWEMY